MGALRLADPTAAAWRALASAARVIATRVAEPAAARADAGAFADVTFTGDVALAGDRLVVALPVRLIPAGAVTSAAAARLAATRLAGAFLAGAFLAGVAGAAGAADFGVEDFLTTAVDVGARLAAAFVTDARLAGGTDGLNASSQKRSPWRSWPSTALES